MLFALIKAQCISLFRDRMAMLLTFALPCVMFTVFAIIFGTGSAGAERGKLKVLVLDQDETRSSERLLDSLQTMKNLEITLLENTITDGAAAKNQATAAQSHQGSTASHFSNTTMRATVALRACRYVRPRRGAGPG